MSERNEVLDNLGLGYIKSRQTKLLPADGNRLVAIVPNLNWQIRIPGEIKCRETFYGSPSMVYQIYSDADKQYNRSFFQNGQNKFHLQAMLLLIANWRQLSNYLQPFEPVGLPEKVFAFPEVSFSDPLNPKKPVTIDCLCSDAIGNIYVIEIGTRRKRQQLLRQLALLRGIYPDVNFIGMLAYYEFNRRSNHAKLDLNFVEE